MLRSCVICQAELGESARVCRRCGSAQEAPATPDQERAVLQEWRSLLYAADLPPEKGVQRPRLPEPGPRALLVKNGLLPSSTELLLDEAVYALKLLSEDPLQPEVARARFEALFTKLELKALAEQGLKRRLETLREDADREARTAAAANRNMWLAFAVLGALLVGAGAWLVRACS